MSRIDTALAALDRALADSTPEARREALAGVLAWCAGRLVDGKPSDTAAQREDDDLLDVKRAAERLKVAPDWIYRRTKTLPFVVRLGPRVVRFSAAGIDRYIQRRTGGK